MTSGRTTAFFQNSFFHFGKIREICSKTYLAAKNQT